VTRALVALLVVAASACAHVVEVKSDPPGAAVVEDGVVLGTTPYALEETTGAAGWRTLEVQKDGRGRRFALAKRAWAAEPILAGAATGLGMFVGGIGVVGVGGAAYVGGLVTAVGGAPPPVAIAIAATGATLLLVGSLSMTLAPAAPLLAASWFGRKSADVVHVDIAARTVTTEPADLADPLVGRTALKDATTAPRTAPPR
jgi:hypothetical protein